MPQGRLTIGRFTSLLLERRIIAETKSLRLIFHIVYFAAWAAFLKARSDDAKIAAIAIVLLWGAITAVGLAKKVALGPIRIHASPERYIAIWFLIAVAAIVVSPFIILSDVFGAASPHFGGSKLSARKDNRHGNG